MPQCREKGEEGIHKGRDRDEFERKLPCRLQRIESQAGVTKRRKGSCLLWEKGVAFWEGATKGVRKKELASREKAHDLHNILNGFGQYQRLLRSI